MPNSSFLPEDYLERRIQRRTNVICLFLFVAVMGGVLGAFAIKWRERHAVRNLHAHVSRQYEDAAKRLEQLDQLQKQKQMMIQKAKVTAVLIERVPRSLVLSELINNMPVSLSLLELNLDTKVLAGLAPAKTALDKAKAEGKKSKTAKSDPQEPPPVEIKPTEISMQVVGLAPTDVEVAQFMTALGRCPLFKDLNLAFSEEITLDKRIMRKFRIDLKINQDLDVREVQPKMVQRGLKLNPMGGAIQINPEGTLMTPKPGVETAAVPTTP